jgi:acyl-coenzyme A thioesterase PaaI-like protein
VLAVAPKHLQQDGYVHAGVQATVALAPGFHT